MRTGKELRVVLAALLIAFLIATAAVWGLSIRQRNRAQAFMTDYVRLKLGTTSFSEAQDLARKYEGIPWYVTQGNMRCTFQRCVFAFKFGKPGDVSCQLAVAGGNDVKR